jgi:hypothetical protein
MPVFRRPKRKRQAIRVEGSDMNCMTNTSKRQQAPRAPSVTQVQKEYDLRYQTRRRAHITDDFYGDDGKEMVFNGYIFSQE